MCHASLIPWFRRRNILDSDVDANISAEQEAAGLCTTKVRIEKDLAPDHRDDLRAGERYLPECLLVIAADGERCRRETCP